MVAVKIYFLLTSSGLTPHFAAVTYSGTPGHCDHDITVGLVTGLTRHRYVKILLTAPVMLAVVRGETFIEGSEILLFSLLSTLFLMQL